MRLPLFALTATVALTSTIASAQEKQFFATFSGPDESASGSASLLLNADQTALSYEIQLAGLDLGGQTAATGDDVLGLHFHNAPVGMNGPIVFGILGSPSAGGALDPSLTDDLDDLMIDAAAGTISGVWESTDTPPLTSSMIDLLNDQHLYLNVHTGAFTGGAVRGQIVPEPATVVLLASGLTATLLWRRRMAR